MISKLLLGISLCPVLMGASRLDSGYVPVVCAPPAAAFGGTQITSTVTLSGAPSQDEVVNLSNSNSAMFSSFPSTVTVKAGSQCAQFQATLSMGAAGTVTITASADGGQASGGMVVSTAPSSPGIIAVH